MSRLLLVLAILSSPVAAFAACTGHGDEQAMSCVEGSIWDPETNACVPIVTG